MQGTISATKWRTILGLSGISDSRGISSLAYGIAGCVSAGSSFVFVFQTSDAWCTRLKCFLSVTRVTPVMRGTTPVKAGSMLSVDNE